MTFLFSSFVLVGCGMVKSKGDAEKIAVEFLDKRISAGGVGESSYYSIHFWTTTSKKKWNNIESVLSKANGDLTSYKIKNWQIKSRAQTNKLSGTFVVMLLDTKYKRGAGTETLTFHRKRKSDKFTIIGHRIATPELQKLIDKGIESVAKSVPEDAEVKKEKKRGSN